MPSFLHHGVTYTAQIAGIITVILRPGSPGWNVMKLITEKAGLRRNSWWKFPLVCECSQATPKLPALCWSITKLNIPRFLIQLCIINCLAIDEIETKYSHFAFCFIVSPQFTSFYYTIKRSNLATSIKIERKRELFNSTAEKIPNEDHINQSVI